MPDFVLRDHRGKTLRSSDLRGHVTLLTFLDSKCKDACPVIAVDLARGIDALSPSERVDVTAAAVSVNPANDTRASVDHFLRSRHALGRIRYLIGPADTLRRLWAEFLILSSVASGNDSIHSAPVRIYGRDGSWLDTLHPGVDLTHENLLHDLRVALALKS
jgi:cytochrome oxidase Cu insertion factor (SCO1/SenC/PrrC family)